MAVFGGVGGLDHRFRNRHPSQSIPKNEPKKTMFHLYTLALSLSSLVLITVITSGSPSSNAAVTAITVNTVADELIDDGDCSLREAIRAANLDIAVDSCASGKGADAIILPPGTYTLTVPGKYEDAGLTGDLDVMAPLTINGADPASTVIDGNGIDRVLHIINTTTTFSGVTIRHGRLGIGEGGAGIYNQGGVVTVFNSTLTGNVAGPDLDCFGGGIETDYFGSLTVDRSIITGNSAMYGGGIAAYYGDVVIRNSWISNNTATVWGGGVHQRTGTLTITNSTLSGNQSNMDGGGIQASLASGIWLTNTTISGNYASLAGGGGSLSSLKTELNNVTIADNRVGSNDAARGGGGLEVIEVRKGDELLIADLRNSIIAGNLDQSGLAPDCLGMVMSQGYNLIQSADGCTISGALTGNIYGLSARLGPLADNGGFSPTHALLPGSSAVDAGNPVLPGSGGISCEAGDQRGVIRPQRVACDVGAYEYVGNVYQTFLPATFCNR